MTYGHDTVLRVLNYGKEQKAPVSWGYYGDKAWTYGVGAHWGHRLEFAVAMICYLFFFPLEEAKEWKAGWVMTVVGYNLAVEFILNTTWHWFMYSSETSQGPVLTAKFNQDNQYEPETKGKAGLFSSSSGQLEREIFFNTLGWLQSSAFQCTMMHLWASGKLAHYTDFWAFPAWSIGHLMFVTYWREFHFYWCHRMIHQWKVDTSAFPWSVVGDPGKFLYVHFHSLHHKSHNPGPWSGLAMHPVEHFFYYTCTLLPLLFCAHPLHFLYAKFHADIAPIGGHDGFDTAGGDFHFLHHKKFDCNYGVPLIDFDRLFGTWTDYKEYVAHMEEKNDTDKTK